MHDIREVHTRKKSFRSLAFWGISVALCVSAIYWLFFGGARHDNSTMAVIGKVVVLLILGGLVVSGFLILFKGDKKTLQELAARHGRILMPGRLKLPYGD